MKLLTFAVGGQARPGVLREDRVLDLEAAGFPAGPNGGLLEIARGGDAMLKKVAKVLKDAKAKSYELSRVKLHRQASSEVARQDAATLSLGTEASRRDATE